MRAISARYLKAMRTLSVVVAWIEVLRDDTVLFSSKESRLRVTAGEVTMDRSARYRRSIDLTMADPKREYLPTSAASLFHPLSGNEIRAYRGIQFPDGAIESYSQGVFGLADVSVFDSVDGYEMRIGGLDRSDRCARSTIVRPYTIAANTNTVTAIQGLIAYALGFTPQWVASVTTYTTNFTVYDVGTDPWEAAAKLAESIGFEVFFNVDGACVIRPQPDPAAGAPSFTYKASEAVINKLGRSLSADQSYNGVLAYGQSPYNSTPAFGEAWDSNPASPTYSGYNPATKVFVAASRFGRRPKILEANPNIRTSVQAQAAAQAELIRLSGIVEVLEFDAFVNAAHEESDVISVQRPELGVNSLYVLDRFNIPLTVDGGMSARTRERRAS